MTFDEYQKLAATTDITASKGEGVLSISFMDKVLGLVGESGEVADKVKKILRDKDAQLSKDDRAELAKELGDVLWYVSTVADNLGVNLDDVASNNIKKLKDRQIRGKLGGSGDDR